MPIYELECKCCKYAGEVLVLHAGDPLLCPACGSDETIRLISATSALTGSVRQNLPGPGDTSCCGRSPAEASCNGPGSCCGKRM